jgi:hypothetical protein
MPYRRLAQGLLETWRVAERALLDVADGSAEAEELHAEITRLRNAYQHAIYDARATRLPEPPPFPESVPGPPEPTG